MVEKKTTKKPAAGKKVAVKKESVRKLTDAEMKKAGGGQKPIIVISIDVPTCRGNSCGGTKKC